MAKMIITVTISDEDMNPESYVDLKNPTPVEMIEYDIQMMEDGNISEAELLDNYLMTNGIAEFEAQP